MTHIYTVTTGRSGTLYLANLLASNLTSALVRHEQLGPDHWGSVTPDIGIRMAYNNHGNTKKVRQWWRSKLQQDERDRADRKWYVETSAQLCTSGLMENLSRLKDDVKIICLNRNRTDVAVSLRARGDFHVNVTIPWVWYLDPRWAANITEMKPEQGNMAVILWFLREVAARKRGFKRCMPDVHFIDADLEALTTEAGVRNLLAELGAGQPDVIKIPGKEGRNSGRHSEPEDYDAIAEMVRLDLEAEG